MPGVGTRPPGAVTSASPGWSVLGRRFVPVQGTGSVAAVGAERLRLSTSARVVLVVSAQSGSPR